MVICGLAEALVLREYGEERARKQAAYHFPEDKDIFVVWHEILLKKLYYYDFRGRSLD